MTSRQLRSTLARCLTCLYLAAQTTLCGWSQFLLTSAPHVSCSAGGSIWHILTRRHSMGFMVALHRRPPRAAVCYTCTTVVPCPLALAFFLPLLFMRQFALRHYAYTSGRGFRLHVPRLIAEPLYYTMRPAPARSPSQQREVESESKPKTYTRRAPTRPPKHLSRSLPPPRASASSHSRPPRPTQ